MLYFISEPLRAIVLDEKGRDAFFELWNACQDVRDFDCALPSEGKKQPFDKKLLVEFKKIWTTIYGEDGDEELHTEYRDALARVAVKLNEIEWSKYMSVTDDFVVAIADGSRTYCDDEQDIKDSISDEKIKRLQSLGFLGPDSDLLSRD